MVDTLDGFDSTIVYPGLTRCACVISQSWKNSIMCTCQADRTITLRTDEGTVRQQLQNDGSMGISAMCVDNTSIWIGFSNGLIHIYDMESYALVHQYKESWGILCMVYSPLLNSMFTGGYGKEILKWSCLCYGKMSKSDLQCHSSAIRSLATEMHCLYSAGDDCSIRCWNVNDNTFKGLWVSDLGNHRSQLIVIDGEYLVCSTHEGIHILHKHNGHLGRFVAAGHSKFGILMKDVKSESIWVSDSSGTISIWDQNFLEIQTSISRPKASLVSAMVPISESCELLIFAHVRENYSLFTLTKNGSSATPCHSHMGESISEVCLRMIMEKAKLVNIHNVTRWLWKAYDTHRKAIFLLYEEQESKKILRRYFRKLRSNEVYRSVFLNRALSLFAKSFDRDVAFACYSLLYQNMRRRSVNASPQSEFKCTENHVRMIPYYRKLKDLQYQVPSRFVEM